MKRSMSLVGLLAVTILVLNSAVPAQKGGKPPKPSPTPTPSPTPPPEPTPVPTPVSSGPGSIDTTFGEYGTVLFQPALPNGGTPIHRRSVLQNDGKIVALLQYGQGGVQNLLARLNTDGSLDDTFGSGGYVYMSWGGTGSGYAYELTKQIVDGEELFVAGGWSPCGRNTCVRVERYTSDGEFDTTFGTAGVTTMSAEYPRAMAVQPDDQKIILVNGAGVVIRLTADGIADASFGSGGLTTAPGMGLLGVAVTSSGKIIVCGKKTKGQPDLAVARLNNDGSLDDGGRNDSTPGDSFGVGGIATTDFNGYNEEAYSVIIDLQDRIIASGQAQMGGSAIANFNAVLVRYLPDGQIDTTFGSGGKTWLDLGGRQDLFTTLALQNDGKIVATGEGRYTTGEADMLTARYNSNGSIDSSFGAGGWVMTDGYGLYDQARSILLQADPTTCEECQKIVVVGTWRVTTSPIQSTGAAVRYLP